MKTKLLLFCIGLLCLTSCIKDEAPYKEADIEQFNLPDSIMVSSVISGNSILVMVSDTTGITKLNFAPDIKLSPQATVFPALGDSVQFVDYVATYKVTSEDKTIEKIYTVEVVPYVSMKFDFEKWTTKFFGTTKEYPMLDDQFWSNANAGVAIILSPGALYPTRPTEDSYKGQYAALLETQKGKNVLGMKTPLFTGSMFRGVFSLKIPAVKSAQFGQIQPKYAGKPVLFTGYYKYKPGEVFTDVDENIIPDRVDECSIYAVMYKVTKGAAGRNEFLDGTNINTSDKVIGRAALADGSAKSEFTKFSIPFVYTEELDYNTYDYKFAVVFSSSKAGDFYEGAVGSTLIVDEVEVVCDKIED